MYGLAPQTKEIFEKVSKLASIKPYTLVGGTALSLQIGHRLSEDLDFMSWRTSKTEKMEVGWVDIMKDLTTIGQIQKREVWGFDHVEFEVSGVKFSFYACDKYSPVIKPVEFLNNIRLADINSIAAMKMEVMLRRSNFRDYYDIYAIMKAGGNLMEAMSVALKYSNHQLSKKNLLAMLSSGDRFKIDSSFKNLEPKYDVSPKEIESAIKNSIRLDLSMSM